MPDIIVRQHQNILWLILNRPPLNLLTVEMLDQLHNRLRAAVQQPPRLIVITGTGEQSFCAGVDLPGNVEAQRTRLLLAGKEADECIARIHSQSIPMVALVKGAAFGAGCELAALCDTIIVRDDAQFRLPAVNATVFPSAIATALPTAVGHEVATRLQQSGETLTAREALRLGLVHQVLPSRRFLQDAEELLLMLATVR